VADLREAAHLERLAGQDPLLVFNRRVDAAFDGFEARVEAAVHQALAAGPVETGGPAATWTYLVDDNPFQDKMGLALVGNLGVGAVAAAAAWPALLFWGVYRWLTRSSHRSPAGSPPGSQAPSSHRSGLAEVRGGEVEGQAVDRSRHVDGGAGDPR
jgi:hypothetical protein